MKTQSFLLIAAFFFAFATLQATGDNPSSPAQPPVINEPGVVRIYVRYSNLKAMYKAEVKEIYVTLPGKATEEKKATNPLDVVQEFLNQGYEIESHTMSIYSAGALLSTFDEVYILSKD